MRNRIGHGHPKCDRGVVYRAQRVSRTGYEPLTARPQPWIIPACPVDSARKHSLVRKRLRAERARILSELLNDLDELADTAARTMRAEIPAYAAQDEDFHADVRSQVAQHYRSKLAVLFEDRTVTLDDIAFTRRAGMRRARAGVALADYINAFRVGQQVFWESVLKRAGHSFAGHEAALSLAAPIMRYCDFASTHAANAYMEFQQLRRGGGRTTRAGTCWRPCWPGRAHARRAARRGPGVRPRARHPHAAARGDRGPARAARRRTGGKPVTTGPDRGVDARHAACAAISRAGANGTGRCRSYGSRRSSPSPRSAPAATPRSCATGCRPCGRASSARASSWRWASAPCRRDRPDPAGLRGGPHGAGVPARGGRGGGRCRGSRRSSIWR